MPPRCNWCGADLAGKPYARLRNVKTGVILNLCLKGCRWFPEAYPTHDWENWQEEIVNAVKKIIMPAT